MRRQEVRPQGASANKASFNPYITLLLLTPLLPLFFFLEGTTQQFGLAGSTGAAPIQSQYLGIDNAAALQLNHLLQLQRLKNSIHPGAEGRGRSLTNQPATSNPLFSNSPTNIGGLPNLFGPNPLLEGQNPTHLLSGSFPISGTGPGEASRLDLSGLVQAEGGLPYFGTSAQLLEQMQQLYQRQDQARPLLGEQLLGLSTSGTERDNILRSLAMHQFLAQQQLLHQQEQSGLPTSTALGQMLQSLIPDEATRLAVSGLGIGSNTDLARPSWTDLNMGTATSTAASVGTARHTAGVPPAPSTLQLPARARDYIVSLPRLGINQLDQQDLQLQQTTGNRSSPTAAATTVGAQDRTSFSDQHPAPTAASSASSQSSVNWGPDGFPFDLPTPLGLPDDHLRLSAHQVFLRQQIEAFRASHQDVSTHKRGRNKPIVVGQVGIRCRHCAHVPVGHRQKGSTYFPAALDGLYQAAQNMSTMHLQCGLCSGMPEAVRQQFVFLISTKASSSGAGRPYWAKAAKKLGLVDSDNGIRFVRDVDVVAKASSSADQEGKG